MPKTKSPNIGVEPAPCELEQNKSKKKTKDQNDSSDSNFYKPPNRSGCSKPCSSHSRCSNSSVSPNPQPERMRSDKALKGYLCGPLSTGAKFNCTEPIIICCPSQNRTRIEKTREAATDKRGIERVPFATVHSLGAAVAVPRPEDAATIAPKLFNSDSKEATPETKVGDRVPARAARGQDCQGINWRL